MLQMGLIWAQSVSCGWLESILKAGQKRTPSFEASCVWFQNFNYNVIIPLLRCICCFYNQNTWQYGTARPCCYSVLSTMITARLSCLAIIASWHLANSTLTPKLSLKKLTVTLVLCQCSWLSTFWPPFTFTYLGSHTKL